MRPFFGSLLTVALLIAGPLEAHADSAQRLIERGLELREARRDAEALKLFERAYALKPSAQAKAQIGLAQQALGLWVEAEESLVDALGSRHSWIRKYRKPLRTSLAQVRKRLGNLEIVGDTEGAELFVDGQSRAQLPLRAPLRVVAGTFPIEVRREGFWPVARRVTVEAGSTARELIKLTPKPADEPPPPRRSPPVATTVPPEREPAPAESQLSKKLKPTSSPSRFSNPWGWTLSGLGVAGLATGTVALIIREGHVADFNSDDCLVDNLPRIINCPDEKNAADQAQAVATAGFVVGGAALVASGLVFWLIDPSDEPSPTALEISSDRTVLTWTHRW